MANNTVTPDEARRELARRELERRRSSTSSKPVTLYGGIDSLIGAIRGGADVASVLGKNMAGNAAATLGGMLALQESPDAMMSAYNQIGEKYQAQPQTQIGQNVIGGLANVGEKVDTALTDVAGIVPGGPLAQTFAKTALTGPLELLGYGKLKGAPKPMPRTPRASQSGFVGPLAEMDIPTTGIEVNNFVPSTADVFKMASHEYNRAQRLGGGIRPETLQSAAKRFSRFKNDVGIDIDFNESLHGPAVAVQKEILDAFNSGNVDFNKLMSLRESASDVAGDPLPRIRMRGVLLRDAIDDFVDNLSIKDMPGGNPKAASEALNNARAMWRDASAARKIELELELAEIDAGDATGHGIEHKIRNRFRQLSRRIAKGQERGFTKDEVKMIRKIAASGDPLQWLSKFSVNHPIYAGAGLATTSMMGLPWLGPAMVGAGQVSRYLLDKKTMSLANQASELARSGGLLYK